VLLLLFPVVEGSSSEDNGDDEDVLDMNTKGNVNVNVPFACVAEVLLLNRDPLLMMMMMMLWRMVVVEVVYLLVLS